MENLRLYGLMADQPEHEIIERISPDPSPTQFQCMTSAPAFEETHLAGDQSETLKTQLDAELTASPLDQLDPSRVEFRDRRFSKTRIVPSTCECGHEVSNAEIEKGDAVMQCKVPGARLFESSRKICQRAADDIWSVLSQHASWYRDVTVSRCPSCD